MRVTRTAVGALVLLGLTAREGSPGPPSTGALAGWDVYVKATETRIDAELARGQPFLAQDVLVPTRSAETERLGRTERPVFIQRMPETTRDGRRIEAPGAMLHHWLGSILVPGVQVQTVIDFVQDYNHHARVFEDVVESKLLSRQGDRFEAFLKLRRTKVLTVYYHTVHLVDYRTHDALRASSRSVATKIAELDRPGTLNEREKSPAEERGFMWRLNSVLALSAGAVRRDRRVRVHQPEPRHSAAARVDRAAVCERGPAGVAGADADVDPGGGGGAEV